MRKQLLSWQWQHYATAHRDRGNLLLHIVTAPIFLAGVASLITGLARLTWPLAVAGFIALLAVMIVQGRGHRREANPPIAFLGPADVLARIFAEQLITFPRFVLSGGWLRAWREAAKAPHPA